MAKFDSSLDRLFTALSDPTRRRIVSRLSRGPATVSELSAAHDMALPSFMGHLARLEKAGLIRSVKRGRVRTCTLSPDALRPAQDWMSEQRQIWSDRLNRLDDYAITLNNERKHDP